MSAAIPPSSPSGDRRARIGRSALDPPSHTPSREGADLSRRVVVTHPYPLSTSDRRHHAAQLASQNAPFSEASSRSLAGVRGGDAVADEDGGHAKPSWRSAGTGWPPVVPRSLAAGPFQCLWTWLAAHHSEAGEPGGISDLGGGQGAVLAGSRGMARLPRFDAGRCRAVVVGQAEERAGSSSVYVLADSPRGSRGTRPSR